MDTVALVDTSLRDGQMSLWATNMTTAMMLPVLESLDRAGFDAVEVIGSSFFKKCVRDLREDPWERIRLLRGSMRTPLRAIKSRHIAAFQTTPAAVSRLWMERLAANGIRQVRISDPSNTVAHLKEQVRIAREVGLDPIVNLIFSVSPKHTDAYYAERAAALADVPAMRLCLKDPGGLLTPERIRPLTETLTASARGRPVEFHGHCNTGLGPLCALEAVRNGIRIVNTAIPPLSDAASLPSAFSFSANVRTLGHDVAVDEQPVREVERHLRAVADRESFPVGTPAEYDLFHYTHQVPGGMISNFSSQLGKLGMADRVTEVLEEAARVRADLGYPIMVTPYSQFVGGQAALNVIVGERYQEVTDEVIAYASGLWGADEAEGVDQDVRDRILSRPRADEVARQSGRDRSLAEVRRELDAGPSVSDDEFLLRFLTGIDDVAAMRQAASGPATGYGGDDLVALVRAAARAANGGYLSLRSGDVRVTVRVRDQGGTDENVHRQRTG